MTIVHEHKNRYKEGDQKEKSDDGDDAACFPVRPFRCSGAGGIGCFRLLRISDDMDAGQFRDADDQRLGEDV